MRPHWAADRGSTLQNFSWASWTGVQVEQKICSSSHACTLEAEARSLTCWSYLVNSGQGNCVEDELEDLCETESVLPSDIKTRNCLSIK